MNWQELRRILTMHEVWVASDGDDGKQADLSGADLRGKFLNHANLRGARMANANLTWGNLKGADLRGANLVQANLKNANLTGADLVEADLSDANLVEANLYEADLRWADLDRANLYEADLRDANLEGANLEYANLEYATLGRANLVSANLSEAYLSHAKLVEANLKNANLTGADLVEANLKGANLEGANLEGANLEGANLEGANLQGANVDRVILPGPRWDKKMVAFGRKRRGAKALQKVSAPMQIAAFKRAFPQAFETIKMDLTGGTLDPERAKKLLDAYGLVWWVTKAFYTSKSQRISSKPNDVLQLNVDIALLTDKPNLIEVLEAIRKTSTRSDHPVVQKGLFTIGWVRYSLFKNRGVLLIEEVQSDVWIVRTKLDDEDFQSRLQAQGFTDELIREALALLQPFVERFYQDALSLIFDVAEEFGLTVEMLSYYEHKQEVGAPPHVYETLPKSMGMKKTAEFKSPIEARKLWQIKPNPSRGRSGSIPDAFLWKRA